MWLQSISTKALKDSIMTAELSLKNSLKAKQDSQDIKLRKLLYKVISLLKIIYTLIQVRKIL